MSRAERFIPGVLFIVLTLAAIAPIRSYDLFWHLSSGRWIVENRALPVTDPFTVASDREPWINGNWLIQVAAYGLHTVVGLKGLSIVRGVCAALLFTLVYVFAVRASAPHIALALVSIAFAGAMPVLDVRPASVAALFVVLAIELRTPVAHALLAMTWINVHPSAILAPIVTAFSTRRAAPVVASALALLLNPFGVKALIAPVVLMSYVTSGAFVNAEWLPSLPARFPLLYIAAAIGVIAFIAAHDYREHWWRVALFVLFAYLAIRHVRHQPLFFAAFPLLVAPVVGRADRKPAYTVSVAAILFAVVTSEHYLGLMRNRFPVQAVARLKVSGLRGNIYQPDQFGGYVMWAFYPERRALTDGRNELYQRFLSEMAEARGDERAWRALLRKYRVDLAVDEYQPRLEVVDATARRVTKMPASLAYWPRKEWALIGYDQAAMVFARRAAFPEDLIRRYEIQRVVD